jgi:hypothetical protein
VHFLQRLQRIFDIPDAKRNANRIETLFAKGDFLRISYQEIHRVRGQFFSSNIKHFFGDIHAYSSVDGGACVKKSRQLVTSSRGKIEHVEMKSWREVTGSLASPGAVSPE